MNWLMEYRYIEVKSFSGKGAGFWLQNFNDSLKNRNWELLWFEFNMIKFYLGKKFKLEKKLINFFIGQEASMDIREASLLLIRWGACHSRGPSEFIFIQKRDYWSRTFELTPRRQMRWLIWYLDNIIDWLCQSFSLNKFANLKRFYTKADWEMDELAHSIAKSGIYCNWISKKRKPFKRG